MRVFVVIGTYRSAGNAERLRALAAEPVLLDLLDPAAVRRAVLEAQPDAIVHQATALADARFCRSRSGSSAAVWRDLGYAVLAAGSGEL